MIPLNNHLNTRFGNIIGPERKAHREQLTNTPLEVIAANLEEALEQLDTPKSPDEQTKLCDDIEDMTGEILRKKSQNP
jgi:hypothetical protein